MCGSDFHNLCRLHKWQLILYQITLQVKCGQHKASLVGFINNPPRIELPMGRPQGLCKVDCINTQDITDDALCAAFRRYFSWHNGRSHIRRIWPPEVGILLELCLLQQGVLWEMIGKDKLWTQNLIASMPAMKAEIMEDKGTVGNS